MKQLIDYARSRRNEPIEKLAFALAGRNRAEAAFILQQVEGWQRLRTKVPSWAAIDHLLFPPKLSLEQCSGEAAAAYKAELAARLFPEGGASMADLTGGLGVDFAFLAPRFRHAVYVERHAELCTLARHNFPLLGLPAAEIVNGDGVQHLQHMPPVDLIMLDPARRAAGGQKTVRLADCEPDVTVLLPLLRQKARHTLVKLSPMLDISEALRALPESVSEVHVTGNAGECKDLLLVINGQGRPTPPTPLITVAEGSERFSFTRPDEAAAPVAYAAAPPAPGDYLYEPGAAMMKAGAFALTSARFGLQKLAPNSHLYLSATPAAACFPGREFRVLRCFGFARAEAAALRALAPKANLAVRNFPATVAELRKRLALKEGGSLYLFATTLANGHKVLILCEKPAQK